MDYLDKLKSGVEKKFNELQEYTSVYNKKSKEERTKLMTEYKEEFIKNPAKVDLKAIAKDMLYINGFYQTDIRKLQVQLLDLYNFSKDVNPEIEFSKEIVDTVTILKNSLPKQLFVVEDGELKEIEKGKTEQLKEDFEKRNYFNMFEKQITSILNA